MPRVNLLLALLFLPLIVGCEGCRRDPDAPPEPKPLPPFTGDPATAFPSDGTPTSGIKLGHWVTASQPLRSNESDVRGEIVCRAITNSSASDDGETLSIQGPLPSTRPVVLPKGQMRRFEYRVLTSLPLSSDLKKVELVNGLMVSTRPVDVPDMNRFYDVLSTEEFYFVILSERPERFAKFQVSDWVRPYRDQLEFKDPRSNYRIIIPSTDDLLPLADTVLDWTSTAVLLWDDLSPDALTPQQQTAIADWVRFGGQLIVNGAEASEAIAKTSLGDLLPLTPSGNIELDPDAGAELLQNWAVATDTSTEKQIALLREQSARVAVDGPLSSDAVAVADSGSLVVTRRVGRGRVVQTRFDVTSDWLINWQSYDSFVNAVLLSRPPRKLQESGASVTVQEAPFDTDPSDLIGGVAIEQIYPTVGVTAVDPAFNSRFHLAARDLILPMTETGYPTSSLASRYEPLTAIDAYSGISGWDDRSDVIGLSRRILRDQSGIEIPRSSLVIRSLGLYLLILVPVNYLVFRLIGRLEYAWLAVPLIAIAGAAWVARSARLDIGFARSRTEIALLEMQPQYSRGHLSRVVAIYNSLSSTYDIEFKTSDAAAAPVREGDAATQGEGVLFQTGYSEGPILSGLPVISNKVRMVHAEQVVDLGGPIGLDAAGQLVNESSLPLADAFVVEKSDSGETQIAVLGSVDAGATVKLRFRPLEEVKLPDDLPLQSSQLLRSLASPESMPSGSMRLVARYDGAMEGMSIKPEPQQSFAQTIVLVHLKHAPWPQPQPDINLISDFRRVLTDEDTVD